MLPCRPHRLKWRHTARGNADHVRPVRRRDQGVARRGLWRANLPMPFPVLEAGEPLIAMAAPILESS
jgi:hypothetical protein